eukprot:6475676-Amphidinium_carterae.1
MLLENGSKGNRLGQTRRKLGANRSRHLHNLSIVTELVAEFGFPEVPLPLHTVHVDVLIVRTIAETTLTQLYKSDRLHA